MPSALSTISARYGPRAAAVSPGRAAPSRRSLPEQLRNAPKGIIPEPQEICRRRSGVKLFCNLEEALGDGERVRCRAEQKAISTISRRRNLAASIRMEARGRRRLAAMHQPDKQRTFSVKHGLRTPTTARSGLSTTARAARGRRWSTSNEASA